MSANAFALTRQRMRGVVARFDQQNCLTIARSLTFTYLLTPLPAMTVVYRGLGFLPAYATTAAEAKDFIFENLVPSSSLLVQQKLSEFAGRVEGLSQGGLFSLVIILLLLLLTIEQPLNAIWRVEKLLSTLARLLSLIVLLTIGPVLVLTGVSASGYQLSLLLLANADIIGPAPLASNHLPTLCLLILFSGLLAIVSNAVARPH